jgi:hypothetical protein
VVGIWCHVRQPLQLQRSAADLWQLVSRSGLGLYAVIFARGMIASLDFETVWHLACGDIAGLSLVGVVCFVGCEAVVWGWHGRTCLRVRARQHASLIWLVQHPVLSTL